MKKKFNPKVTEINNIGDELRFQREYYNYKNSSKKLIPRIATRDTKSEFLGDVLQNFLDENFEYMKIPKKTARENYGEYGTGEDILYAIEHNRLKSNREKRNEKYNPNAYYLRMYSLFKVYGFLDDYEILTLLDKYNIEPRFEKTQKEKKRIEELIQNDYRYSPKKSLFSLRYYMLDNDWIEKELKNKYRDLKHICFEEYNEKILNGTRTSICFRNLKSILIENFNKLTNIEKKYISLEFGKGTYFIEDFLTRINKQDAKDKINITLETLSRIINYLKLNNTDLEFIVNQKIKLPKKHRYK